MMNIVVFGGQLEWENETKIYSYKIKFTIGMGMMIGSLKFFWMDHYFILGLTYGVSHIYNNIIMVGLVGLGIRVGRVNV